MGNCLGGGGGGGGAAAYAAGGGAAGGAAAAARALARPHGDDIVTALAACGGGTLLSCADSGEMALWAWDGGAARERRWARAHAGCINAARYLPRGARALTASRDCAVRVWALGGEGDAPLATLAGHTMSVSAVAARADGAQCASGGRDYTVAVWDLECAERLAHSKVSRNMVTSLEYVPGEAHALLQGSEDLSVRLWDTRAMGGAPAAEYRGTSANIPLSLGVSADGNYFATGSKGFDGVGCEVFWWDRRMGAVVHSMGGHSMAVTATHVHGGGARPYAVTTASTDTTLRLWDVNSGEAGACAGEHSLPSSPARPLSAAAALAPGAGLPDGCPFDAGVAVADVEGDVQLWGLDTAEMALTPLASSCT